MFLVSRHGIGWLAAATLMVVFWAGPAHAQRGGCMRQQVGQRSLQTQSFVPQQAYLSQVTRYALQLYTMQQSALQQYAAQAQMNALAQNFFLAQFNGTQVNGGQLNGPAVVELLQMQLDDVHDAILDLEENGRPSTTQLRTLRQQEKALTKQLRAVQKQVLATR
jgi:hypothetical protein